jgi:hypothetical protein
MLKIKDFKIKDLKIYYNGDRGLTDFKKRCYKQRGKSWFSVGQNTPSNNSRNKKKRMLC